MRAGAEYFLEPSEPAQRRYEAMRAYFVDGLAAGEVGERFGYSPANVHQMASELRAGQARVLPLDSKPGPKGPRKAERIRDRVLELRALDRSVAEIAAELGAAGTPVSAQTVWTILARRGLERLPRRAGAERGAPPRLAAGQGPRARRTGRPGRAIACDHAGLFLLVPAIVELGLARARRILRLPVNDGALGVALARRRCCWPSARAPRAHSHAHALADDPGLGAADGADRAAEGHAPDQLLLPRAPRRQRAAPGAASPRRLRELGLATGEQGFNLDFHAIRHHGADVPLEKHYVPRRCQRTRAVLTFFAQDHASQEMVYANADLTKAEQAREVIAFADYWQERRRHRPRACSCSTPS